jgi:hypothetical protein
LHEVYNVAGIKGDRAAIDLDELDDDWDPEKHEV